MIHLADGGNALFAALRTMLPLAGTLLAYEIGVRLQRRLGGNALANPVLVAVLLVSAAMAATGTSTEDYAGGVRPLALLLGPATIALALPLYRSLPRIRQALLPVLVGVGVGAVTAGASAVAIAAALGGPDLLLRSIATKSVTTAISMAVAQEIGGDPVLAVGLTVLTGISGGAICTWVLDLAGVHDPRARGLATGVTAHGIGTARMLALDAEAGAFSGLAMALAGLATGVALPLVAAWFDRASS